MFFKANALDALGNFDEAIEYYDYVEHSSALETLLDF